MNDWKQKLKQLWQGREKNTSPNPPVSRGPDRQTKNSQPIVVEPLWQPRGAGPDSNQRSVIIGLDFGTAFTKVVVGRQPGHVAIPFPSSPTESNYLIPSCFVEQGNGACTLSATPKQNETLHADLKMPLLGDSPNEDDLVNAVAFAALVLRHTRNWVLQEYEKAYRNNWLDWQLNLGVATENYHDNKIIDSFKKVAFAAWAVSILPGDITVDVCRSCLTQLNSSGHSPLPKAYNEYHERLIPADNIDIVPEIVAQIAAYTNSPDRQDDLHMLIDVGAGTLDIVLFIVGDDECPIMAKAVHPLGAEKLRQHRLQLISDDHAVSTDSPVTHMHNTKQFAESHHIELSELTEHDRAFQNPVGMAILKPIQHVKNKRYPTSRRWHDGGVLTFVVGGGSNVDLYSSLIDRRFACMPQTMQCRRYPLPQAGELDAPDLEEQYAQRLSVAYGLSFNPLNLAAIKRADRIPDQEVQAVKDLTSSYITKDVM